MIPRPFWTLYIDTKSHSRTKFTWRKIWFGGALSVQILMADRVTLPSNQFSANVHSVAKIERVTPK